MKNVNYPFEISEILSNLEIWFEYLLIKFNLLILITFKYLIWQDSHKLSK
jgi:hypothetical protein